jgi:hypothetical protein
MNARESENYLPISRHCDEWKYIIIGRIFESEIILIPIVIRTRYDEGTESAEVATSDYFWLLMLKVVRRGIEGEKRTRPRFADCRSSSRLLRIRFSADLAMYWFPVCHFRCMKFKPLVIWNQNIAISTIVGTSSHNMIIGVICVYASHFFAGRPYHFNQTLHTANNF